MPLPGSGSRGLTLALSSLWSPVENDYLSFFLWVSMRVGLFPILFVTLRSGRLVRDSYLALRVTKATPRSIGDSRSAEQRE